MFYSLFVFLISLPSFCTVFFVSVITFLTRDRERERVFCDAWVAWHSVKMWYGLLNAQERFLFLFSLFCALTFTHEWNLLNLLFTFSVSCRFPKWGCLFSPVRFGVEHETLISSWIPFFFSASLEARARVWQSNQFPHR